MENKTIQIFTIIIISALLSCGFLNLVFAKAIDSPRKQLESGVAPKDIVCKSGLVLVVYAEVPVCLKPSTISKLEQRGTILGREFISPENQTNKMPEPSSKGSTVIGKTGQPQIPIETVTSSSGGIVNFYVNDNDLNTSPNGIDVIQTKGLLEFAINGIPVNGPDTMTETGLSTGKFSVRFELPDSVDGRPLKLDDILEIKYLDQTDVGGKNRTTTQSVPLTQAFAQVQTSGGGQNRIGHEFVVRIYEPDLNLDSKDTDTIPLSKLEYRGEGGIRTTLANPVFDANSSFLLETGPNTGIFEVIIKIPRTIDGKTVNIGDWYEIRYVDTSTPSGTSEEIKLKGRIG